jgi:hypothetical protein
MLSEQHIQYSAKWLDNYKHSWEGYGSKLLCHDNIHQKYQSRWLASVSDFELCTKYKYMKQQWFRLYGLMNGYTREEATAFTSTSALKMVATGSWNILVSIHQITLCHNPEVLNPTTTPTHPQKKTHHLIVAVSLFNCCKTQPAVWKITS